MFMKEKSPFDVDLRCNVNIEINVAMRLGDLIRASGTEDKQLLALGYRLSNAMRHLADNLDDRQWKKFSEYVEESSEEYEDYPSHGNVGENHYHRSPAASENMPAEEEYERRPRTLKSIVESRSPINSKE